MKKRTLQEIADFFGCWVFQDAFRQVWVVDTVDVPQLGETSFYCSTDPGANILIKPNLIDYTGDWKDSLTAPSEEE